MVLCLCELLKTFVVNVLDHFVEFLFQAFSKNLDRNLLVGLLTPFFLLGSLSHEYRFLTGPFQ